MELHQIFWSDVWSLKNTKYFFETFCSMQFLIFRIVLRSFALENAPNVTTVISKTLAQNFLKFCQPFTYDQIKQHTECPSLASFFEFKNHSFQKIVVFWGVLKIICCMSWKKTVHNTTILVMTFKVMCNTSVENQENRS